MTGMNNSTELKYMALAKAVIAVLLVIVVFYSVVAQVAIDERLIQLILMLLGGYFGFSAKMYFDAAR